ncbi:Short-chain dehydrogenase/reductase family protein [Mycena venus]|uniref:Short-chain dehydrogenase/reductase family protein n=1 Tax=Mycena venus TaxID=2733690 RepID=A0A8H7CPG6_9AGAR|nr:Short-chain dehydrogenase/reductase family protein [Mycena venus]
MVNFNRPCGCFSLRPPLLLCFFSLYFRCVGRTPGRFDLFGKCDSIQPPYSGAETLFGRSALRPLVRGESRVIAVFRAILLACLFLAIPAFGFYSTVIAPIQAEVMTYNIKLSQPWQGLILSSITSVDDTVDELAQHLIDQNITLVFFYTGDSDNRASSPVANVTVTGKTVLSNATQVCHNSNIPSRERTTVVCPFSWEALSLDGLAKSPYLNVSASFPDPIGILYVKIGQGDPSDVDSYAEVTPLAAGSHLSAILTRKRRDLFSNAQDVLGITTPYRSIMMNPVLLLQQDPFPPDSAASLRLRMRDDIGPYATEIVQDYTNASVLNGFATFGGFWTFVNGTFALIFGADLLYFLFRRRSLSALGIVHLFQRRNLTRKWNEDFPALHTEGGHPGSKSAGIVAFLRERLVDLDEDCHPRDPEAQHHSYDSDDKVPRETHSGGIVSETEEIPLSSGFRRHDFHS